MKIIGFSNASSQAFLTAPIEILMPWITRLKAALGHAEDSPAFGRAVHSAKPGFSLDKLGACRTWGVESENRPQRGQFLPDLQAHSPAMGQKDGEKWTAAVDLQPTIPKSDRLLASTGHAVADVEVKSCTTAPRCRLRVVREFDSAVNPDCAGRMVISGRMADVCAELDRMALRGTAVH